MIRLLASLVLVIAVPDFSFALEEELNRGIEIEAVQPPATLIQRLEERPSEGEPGVQALQSLPASDYPYRMKDVLLKDGIPFYPYYALKSGSNHVIHPMALGRFLLRNAEGSKAEDAVAAAQSIAYELPNGGLAWYYPRHYRVARMLGPKLKYSSISQGTMLSGLTEMSEKGVATTELPRKVFQALLFPFERGGVNLANRAVLEMPSFYGPPEIVLNGWLDALLHTLAYGEKSGDPEAINFFKDNVKFLARILPNFDVREARISRYSDLSPYRVKVTLAKPEDVQTLQVLYRPLYSELPAIRIPLKAAEDPKNVSAYDNHLIRQDGKDALVWISCSQLYETVLISSSPEMSATIQKGEIDRKSTTPGVRGEELVLVSERDGDLSSVTISPDDGLICGYPTNFSKGGIRNHYHPYHIVSLMLIAMSEHVQDAERKTLLEMALKWKDDQEFISRTENLSFRPLEKMLGDVTSNHSTVKYTEFDALLADVKVKLGM